MENIKNKILLVTDIPGYGKVALQAQSPILTKMGFDLYNLPTALVSNTLNYGKFSILETTEYMRETIKVWDQLDFKFGAISIGFIGAPEQVPILRDFIKSHREKNPEILVGLDTIMGDDGSFYNGITTERNETMRALSGLVDYITPNYTEACFLTGIEYKDKITCDEAEYMASKLKRRTGADVVITSIPLIEGNTMVIYTNDGTDFVDYEEVPIHMPGTGDIFSAVLMGNMLRGKNLAEATEKAGKVVKEMLIKCEHQQDKFHGIPLEQYIHEVEVL